MQNIKITLDMNSERRNAFLSCFLIQIRFDFSELTENYKKMRSEVSVRPKIYRSQNIGNHDSVSLQSIVKEIEIVHAGRSR